MFSWFLNNPSQYYTAEYSFHKSTNSALTKDVQPIADWTDLPPFCRDPHNPSAAISDPVAIEDSASDIRADANIAISSSQLFLVVLAIRTEQPTGESVRLKRIQLRMKHRIYIFDVWLISSLITLMYCFFFSVFRFRLSLRLAIFSLDFGRYAKLKGAVEYPSLHFTHLPALSFSRVSLFFTFQLTSRPPLSPLKFYSMRMTVKGRFTSPSFHATSLDFRCSGNKPKLTVSL
jgi:hypothetical protein